MDSHNVAEMIASKVTRSERVMKMKAIRDSIVNKFYAVNQQPLGAPELDLVAAIYERCVYNFGGNPSADNFALLEAAMYAFQQKLKNGVAENDAIHVALVMLGQ